MVFGKYRVELYLAPTRGKPLMFMKSEPDAIRFSVSAYVWPFMLDIRGPLRRRVRS